MDRWTDGHMDRRTSLLTLVLLDPLIAAIISFDILFYFAIFYEVDTFLYNNIMKMLRITSLICLLQSKIVSQE